MSGVPGAEGLGGAGAGLLAVGALAPAPPVGLGPAGGAGALALPASFAGAAGFLSAFLSALAGAGAAP